MHFRISQISNYVGVMRTGIFGKGERRYTCRTEEVKNLCSPAFEIVY